MFPSSNHVGGKHGLTISRLGKSRQRPIKSNKLPEQKGGFSIKQIERIYLGNRQKLTSIPFVRSQSYGQSIQYGAFHVK